MNAMINYLIEVNTELLLFMVLYWAILKNETQFQFKRLYLLVALLGSILFPLFHFGDFSTVAIPSIGQVIPEYWLPEIVINGGAKAATKTVNDQLSSWAFAEYVYLLIALFLAIVLLYRIISISYLIIESVTYRWRNYFVTETNEPKPTFSFFNFILIGKANQLSQKEKEEILLHESIHIQRLHSFDILLVNMIGIICWFNPIVRVYKKTLVQLHEFEADARSVENKDVDTYCGLLAKVALQSAEFPIANHFSNSLTIKRIQMLKTMKHKIQNWKVAALIAIVPLFFFVVACQDQFKNEKEAIATNSESLPQQVKDELKSLAPYYYELVAVEQNEKGKKNLIKLCNESAEMGKGFSHLTLIQTKEGINYAIIGKAKPLKKNESKVFDQVDQIATPLFGMESLHKNVAHTLMYPEEARKKGIEGKVFIEFVIQTNGEMSNFKVLKGLDDSIDTEALRALMQINTKWRPAIYKGEIVKVKMVIPINFKPYEYTNKI
jgi:TonB family protein